MGYLWGEEEMAGGTIGYSRFPPIGGSWVHADLDHARKNDVYVSQDVFSERVDAIYNVRYSGEGVAGAGIVGAHLLDLFVVGCVKLFMYPCKYLCIHQSLVSNHTASCILAFTYL
jgi:hypothetical protein